MKKNNIYVVLIIFISFISILFFINNNNNEIYNDFISKPIIEKENSLVKGVIPGFEINDDIIIIDYPIFVNNKNLDYNILIHQEENKRTENRFKIFKKYKKQKFIIQIKNINGTDFGFLKEMSSNFYIDYYDLRFNKYNDENYKIFENINFDKKIWAIELSFKEKLQGKNTLIKTFSKIQELKKNKIDQIYIYGTDEFKKTYKMDREELNILHKLPDSILSIDTLINDSVTIKYLTNFLKNTTLYEYHMSNPKISKVYDNIKIKGRLLK